jgi:hypothetical protein
MNMALANIHRNIIERANAMGYFPTGADAKRIGIAAAENAKHYREAKAGGFKSTSVTVQSAIDQDIDDAIRSIMDAPRKPGRPRKGK